MTASIYATAYPPIRAKDTVAGKWYLAVVPPDTNNDLHQNPLVLQRDEDCFEFLLMEAACMVFHGPIPDPFSLLIENLELKAELGKQK